MRAEKVVKSTCPYCGVGCQVLLNVKENRIFRVEAPFDSAPNFGRLCVKGRFGTDYVHHTQRLTQPLIRKTPQSPGKRTKTVAPEEWRQSGWDEALDLVVDRLLDLRRCFGADSIASLVCAKATNEDNYLMMKYFRSIIGTNNVDHCARLCHAGSVTALQMAIGSSAMSNSIAEMKDLECFIITGSNPTANHPVIGTLLKQAVIQNGATLIVVDPRRTEMCDFAELHLQHNPNTDTALFNAMAHVVVKEKLVDKNFVERRTEGFTDYTAGLEETTPEWAEGITGVPAEDIRRAARMYATAKAAAIYWGMGISQSVHGTDNALTLVNLALLCGQIGRPGTGLNPLRGQNNVQGCSDSGGLPNVYTAYQQIADPDIRGKFEKAWHSLLPTELGLTTTEMVDEILTDTIKGWYVMGENPLMSEPDLNHARHAVEQLEFFVAQDIFFNETNVYADVILPAAAFAEKDGTFTNSDRRVQRVRQAVCPPGEARPDWQIVSEIAKRTIDKIGREVDRHPGTHSLELDRTIRSKADKMLANWKYSHPKEIWDEMRSVTAPFYGITYERLENEGGVHWPCPSHDHPGSPYLFKDEFPSGRGRFFMAGYTTDSEMVDESYPLVLITGRLLYHWHGGTMTRISALDRIWPECTVEMHPHDAVMLNLEMGDWVDVSSRRGNITTRLLVTERSPAGAIFIPIHFAEAAANTLTNNLIDRRAKIPDYKICAVKVAAAQTIPPDREGVNIPLSKGNSFIEPNLRHSPQGKALEELLAKPNPVWGEGIPNRSLLPEILHEAQAIFNDWLPRPVLKRIARELKLPLAEIYGVTEFFTMFHTKPVGKKIIRICEDAACTMLGSRKIQSELCKCLQIQPGETTADSEYSIEPVRCLGLCDHAPAALVNNTRHFELSPDHADILLTCRSQHDQQKNRIGGPIRIALANIGTINPGRLEEYRAQGGLAALQKALDLQTPEEVIETVKSSKLVGRGGAAFPTGLKWQLTANNPPGPRYVICNADESEAGAFKDRVLMEGDPFRIIEGLLIACYAVGAAQCFLYVRGEHRLGYGRFIHAVAAMEKAGWIGARIGGSDFSCNVAIRRGAGAYVCGEETALMEALEGQRGFPRPRPPFPTTHGLWGQPTVINNVETLAKIPDIIVRGGEWYAGLGTVESAGTKLFSVSGSIRQPGVYEIPFGVPLRHLIFDLAGGTFDGRELQAILTGGAAGTFLKPEHLDTPISYEDFQAINGTIGAGTMIVFDDTVDLLNILTGIGEFFAHESCGQCYPCRIGSQRQAEILHRIEQGRVSPQDVETLRELAQAMADTSICGLGQSAAQATLSAFKHWPKLLGAKS